VRTPCRLPLLLVGFAIAPPVAAQSAAAGSATFQITTQLAASSQAAAVVGSDLTMQITVMTDGHRVAMNIVPSISQSPMAGTQIKMIFTPGIDSVHMGILLPPELAAAGGGIGMRMDGPMSMMGSANAMLGGIMDSVGKAIGKPTYRALGKTSTVAGISCEEWETVAMDDTTLTCVIPTPPALLAMQNQLKTMSGMGAMMAQIPGMADLEKTAYGGRAMTAIRTIDTKRGMHMELTNYTPGAPDPTQMDLPAGLQSMPMPGGGGGIDPFT
jgi:hypothetical protein